MPLAAGRWLGCIAGRDSAGRSIRRDLPIEIVQPLVVRKPPVASTGIPYNEQFIAGGQFPYRVTITRGSLPPGITEQYGFSRLRGSPPLSGSFRFAVSVVDNLGFTVTANVELRVEVTMGAALLADPRVTPGATRTRVPRCTPPVGRPGPSPAALKLRTRLLETYGIWYRPKLYVIDELIPVGLGGHPGQARNLWPQLATQAAATDRVERIPLRRVCRGSLTLEQARARIALRKYTVG